MYALKRDLAGLLVQSKACGRKTAKGKSKRPYPACRPKKVASKITKSEATKKTGPKRVKWSTTASGKKRTK